MGLAGRKVKQKIPNDPRNLSWADDAARFGSNYLSKFGWDSSKGLGVGGEGRTSHIKVAQKLDMLGIGAAHQRDPDGIAWKQNKDFESLLKRLNEANGDDGANEGGATKGTAVEGFVSSGRHTEEVKEVEERDEEEGETDKERKHKRKSKGKDTDERQKKKRKRENKDEEAYQKSGKKRTKGGSTESNSEPTELEEPKSTLPRPAATADKKVVRLVPRHRSHRARHIAAKSLASKSAIAISEILGVSSTPSTSSSNIPSGSHTPQEGRLTTTCDEVNTELDQITTSTKSLEDYFKEKMGKLKGVKSNSTTTGAAQAETMEVDTDDFERRGLGLRQKEILDKDDDPPTGLSYASPMTASLPPALAEAELQAREKKERKRLKKLDKERKRQEREERKRKAGK